MPDTANGALGSDSSERGSSLSKFDRGLQKRNLPARGTPLPSLRPEDSFSTFGDLPMLGKHTIL